MTNVDLGEIQKFESIGEGWWDLNGEMKLLHRLNPLRVKFIQDLIGVHDREVLDIGCGAGILTESLFKQGAKITGIDLSLNAIQQAKNHAAQQGLDIHYYHSSIEEFALSKPNYFEIITCMELLEHVPDPSELIQHCSELLKPGGLIFFSTLNRNLKSFLGAIVAAEYILQLLPKGTHSYEKFIRPSELNQWAVVADLELVKLQGIQYQPWNDHFFLGSDVSINYLACFKKIL